jgi:hypothetical protein
MLDHTREKVSKASEFREAVGLLLGAEEPVLLLQVFSGEQEPFGKLWIKNGAKVVAASVTGTQHAGLLAFLQVLAAHNPRFEVITPLGQPPGDGISVDIADLIADETLVVDGIKGAFLPVHGLSLKHI